MEEIIDKIEKSDEETINQIALGFLISTAFKSYTQYLNKYFKEINLSLSQARVLLVLGHKDHVSIDYLSQQTNINKSSITKSVKILEKKKFIIKKIDPVDNRKKVIIVTKKGKEVQKKALVINNEIEDKLREMIGKNGTNSLKLQLKKLISSINHDKTNQI